MKILCIGQGEIGAPMTCLLAASGHEVYAKDVEDLSLDIELDAMLIMIPFKDKESFSSIVCNYARQYTCKHIIICSTVLPGTCKTIQERITIPVIHTPIMGRHRKDAPNMMLEDIAAYPRFIGADDDASFLFAKELFESAGFSIVRLASTATSELSKLLETTYSGILIGWMQEVERICTLYDVSREETLLLIEAANQRIEFKRPTQIYPGHIGGHCIMPNIELLLQEITSDYLDAVKKSNALLEPK